MQCIGRSVDSGNQEREVRVRLLRREVAMCFRLG